MSNSALAPASGQTPAAGKGKAAEESAAVVGLTRDAARYFAL